MAGRRRAAKADGNQARVTALLRRLGASVQPLHTVGDGCPDAVVGWRGRNLLVEIKDGALPPSRRKLTDDERIWHDGWRGQVCIIETDADVLRLLT